MCDVRTALRRGAGAVAVALCGLLVAPGVSGAATGDISFVDCIAVGSVGCADISATTSGLGAPDGVASSPDGRSVYVAAQNGDAVVHFRRDALTGQLTFADCVAQSAAGCTALPVGVSALDDAVGVAVSPDGADVYVAARNSWAIAHLRRDTVTGALTFVGCVAQGASGGCADSDGKSALREARSVTVSPDGTSVYAGAGSSSDANYGAVAHLARNTATGAVTFVDCIGQAATGCATPGAADTLREVGSVTVSPDGTSVYAAGRRSNAVAHLVRSASTGALSFSSCIGQAASGCTDIAPTDALGQPRAVGVAPGGTNVYVTSSLSNAVAQLKRDAATGALSFGSCVAQGAVGCTSISPTNALDSVRALAISGDGESLYVAGRDSPAVAHLRLDPSGAPTFVSCIGQGALSTGCVDLSPTNALREVRGITVSPDGRNVYSGAGSSSAIARFSRVPAPLPTPPPTPTPVPPPPAPAATPKPPAASFVRAVSLPSTRKCVSRRAFTIRIRKLKGVTYKSVSVSVNGKQVKAVKGSRISAPVVLKGLPKGRFAVRITVTLADGRKLTGTRRYRTCAPKRRGGPVKL